MPRKKNINNRRLDASKYYNMGSTAPSIKPWEYPTQPKVLPQKHPNIKPKPQPKTNYDRKKNREQIKEKALYHLKFLFTSAVILSSCIIIIMFNSIITEQKRNISSLNSQLKTLKEENLSIEADIAEQIDIKYIEKEATERLGMTKPARHQIVYIDVPKRDYTISGDNTVSLETEANLGILDFFKNIISKIFN